MPTGFYSLDYDNSTAFESITIGPLIHAQLKIFIINVTPNIP